MAFDVKAWLTSELGLSGENLDTVVAALAPAADRIQQGHLRQSDYSRHMNELRSNQEKLQAADAALQAEIAAWATRQAQGEPITQKMRDELDTLRANALKLQTAVERQALAQGQDPAEAVRSVLGGQAPVAPPQPTAPDLSGYVKATDLGTTASTLASMALKWPAQFAKIAREHHALTGEELDGEAIVAEIERRAATRNNDKSLDPVRVWEELHDVGSKRTAAAEKRQNELIAAAEARGREAAMAEFSAVGPQAVPSRANGRPSPILNPSNAQGQAAPRKSVLERPQPGNRVAAATAAFRSGKYRQQAPVAPRQ